MNIIEAVKLAFEGKKIRRNHWFFVDKDRCVHIFAPRDSNGKLSDHILKTDYCKSDGSTEYSSFLPEDILANNWEVVDDE